VKLLECDRKSNQGGNVSGTVSIGDTTIEIVACWVTVVTNARATLLGKSLLRLGIPWTATV